MTPSDSSPDEKGVLGSLPNRRPGVETPRRAAARRASGSATPAAGRGPSPAANDDAAAGERSGFEELARAGAGLAVGAAALGARIAGGAVGRVVGRR